jgi:MFS transporter, PPP family, 3-phenylpropionic acid transporter
MPAFLHSALCRFLILYGVLYAGFGVQSPYLPTLLGDRGLGPEAIALVLAASTAVRLAAGPAAGRLADRLDASKFVLAASAAGAAVIALAFLPAHGLWPLLTVGVIYSAALAPLAPLSDTLALGAAAPARSDETIRPGFEYGWVRGAGSAAFILGTVLSGQAVGHFGITAIVWLSAALLGVTASAALGAPRLLPRQETVRPVPATGHFSDFAVLVQIPLYRHVILIAALILGSHAMHDSFAVIRWGAAGIGPATAGVLWSLSVAAEVIVFFFFGRPLIDRLGPHGAAMMAAVAGIVRWAVMAETAWLPAMAAIEALHGLTFALLHLTCMRLLAECVPRHLAATALTLYGTVGIGAPAALLTLASGPLYARFGAQGFWVMAALCVAALLLAWRLRERISAPTG